MSGVPFHEFRPDRDRRRTLECVLEAFMEVVGSEVTFDGLAGPQVEPDENKD